MSVTKLSPQTYLNFNKETRKTIVCFARTFKIKAKRL